MKTAGWSLIRKSCSGQCRDEPSRLASLGERIWSPFQCRTSSLAWSPHSQGSLLGSTTQWIALIPTSSSGWGGSPTCSGQRFLPLQRPAVASRGRCRLPVFSVGAIPPANQVRFVVRSGWIGGDRSPLSILLAPMRSKEPRVISATIRVSVVAGEQVA